MRFVLFLLFVAAANAAQLRRVSEPIPGQYIVKIKSGIDVQSVLPSVRLAGGRVRSVFSKVLNGFSAELSDTVLDVVLNLPAVEYVEEDGVVRAMAVSSWGLDRIDQRSLPLDDSYTPLRSGSGVTVYVLDTGIRKTHNDFGGRVASIGVECLGVVGSCVSGSTRGGDGHGHGTHCAGTVGGTSYGVAKQVSLVAVKVLSDSGSGTNAGIINGIEWVVSQSPARKVISMSLGGGISTALNDAVNAAVSDGVSVAVAAGNDNANACNYSPASAASAVTVGSTTSTDARSWFSNKGTCLDIFAPGSSIVSAGHSSNSASATMSGTSMACPHVAGALALLWQANTSYSPTQLTNQLNSDATSNVVGSPGTGSPNRLLYVN